MHQNKFTPEKPFSPRLIRSNASSKLRSLRCYNPPIRMTKSNSGKISHNEDQNMRPASTTDVIADSHNEKRNQRKIMKQDVRRPVSSQPCRTSLGHPLAEDDANSKHRQTPGVCFVPNQKHTQLSTEVDKQTQLPANVSAQTSSELTKVGEWLKSLNPKDDEIPVAVTNNPILQTVPSMEQHVAALRQTTWEESLDETQRNALLFLNFIEAVTSDVLSRGVFTDRNLNSIISEHVIRNDYGLSK
ncbi:hypothetical protein AHF37_05863 [Paragonimus kellicotti]|nr:hypothetical protein AHF37_05863 [Paragonimus kellicotti]